MVPISTHPFPRLGLRFVVRFTEGTSRSIRARYGSLPRTGVRSLTAVVAHTTLTSRRTAPPNRFSLAFGSTLGLRFLSWPPMSLTIAILVIVRFQGAIDNFLKRLIEGNIIPFGSPRAVTASRPAQSPVFLIYVIDLPPHAGMITV